MTQSAEPAVRSTVRSALAYCSVWAPVGAMAFAIKRKVLGDEGGGFDFVADSMGMRSGAQLSLWQQLSMYRWDVITAAVILPLLWLWLMHRLSPGKRALMSAVVSVVATLILFIELKTLWEVGTLLPAPVLAAGVMGAGRTFAAEYAADISLTKVTILVVACVALSTGAYVSERRGWSLGGLNRLSASRVAVVLAVAGIVVALLPPHVPRTPFSRSGLAVGLLAFAGAGNRAPRASDLADAGPRELVRAYRDLARAPVPNEPSAFFGRARNYNVLFYLYETLPYACARRPAAASALRHFRSLERSGFVAALHYATYPYSRRAYYSIYSGWYPAHGMRGSMDLIDEEDPLLPGLVSSARAQGYRTMAFVPEVASEWENDVKRYRALGFEQHVVPPNAELASAPQGADERIAWQRQRDNDARAMLIDSLAAAATRGRPWIATFNPQLTHGPWPGAGAAAGEARVCALGLALFDEVDRGLGEVLEALERTGQRERTIVVALGDHGLRTSAEYPAFRGATLDDITFHVPLVMHVPGLLNEPRVIPWHTSHVDIAPSLLDLLGISARRQFEQGSPMWDPRLGDRRIFVYAQGYLGADGYVDARRAVMLNYFLGTVSETPWTGALRFDTRDMLVAGGVTSDSAAAVLHRAVALQRLYLSRLSGFHRDVAGDRFTAPGTSAPSSP